MNRHLWGPDLVRPLKMCSQPSQKATFLPEDSEGDGFAKRHAFLPRSNDYAAGTKFEIHYQGFEMYPTFCYPQTSRIWRIWEFPKIQASMEWCGMRAFQDLTQLNYWQRDRIWDPQTRSDSYCTESTFWSNLELRGTRWIQNGYNIAFYGEESIPTLPFTICSPGTVQAACELGKAARINLLPLE